MRGTVLGYDVATGTGAIRSDDGRRYTVHQANLEGGARSLAAGVVVDFEPSADGGNTARSVYPVPTRLDTYINGRSKWVAAILAFFLGAFGIHKFYLGYNKEGVIMLLCFVPGFVLILPALVVGLVALAEAVIYALKTEQEFHDQYVIGRRPWL